MKNFTTMEDRLFTNLLNTIENNLNKSYLLLTLCSMNLNFKIVLKTVVGYDLQSFCRMTQMVNFCRFFASCIFSEPRAAHFRPSF